MVKKSKEYMKEIESIEELQEISEFSSDSYILTSDIDASETRKWNGGKGFDPIKLRGVLDGNGYTIRNLYINRNDSFVGLVNVNKGKIKNLNIENSFIKGNNYVGGFMSHDSGTKMENLKIFDSIIYSSGSYVNSEFSGTAAGIVAFTSRKSIIKNCKAENLLVKSSADIAGGLVGYYRGDYLSECSVENVHAKSPNISGGLIGVHEKKDKRSVGWNNNIKHLDCIQKWNPKEENVIQYTTK